MVNITLAFNDNKVPLYRQLYNHILSEILNGNFKHGEKIPSKRNLATHLDISINTVDSAYQMLTDEGYIISKPKSGFYISKIDKLAVPTKDIFYKEKSVPSKNYTWNLSSNSVDTQQFPFKTWTRISKDIMYNTPELLNHGNAMGDENLRQAIWQYLNEFRGVKCEISQIVVGAGMEYLLSLIFSLFDKNSKIALENPGYNKIAHLIKNSGRTAIPIDIDENGIDIKNLENSGANAVYITPSHQYPTGVTMPAPRRSELLGWANENNGYIIEDDYDSEFRFEGKPIPSLQGMDTNSRVIYASSFSKSLAPSIRIAYMVLPISLLEVYHENFGGYSATVSRFEQQTLCGFMQDGHFARYINRMRGVYRKKREFLIKTINENLSDFATILQNSSGLHILLKVNNGMSDKELYQSALENKVKINLLSGYNLTSKHIDMGIIVISFASLDENDLKESILALKSVWG